MSESTNDSDPEFSEWLHGRLVDEYAGETEAWARERVARVMQRLNARRRNRDALVAEILWIPDCNAFTLAGRYIYISRRLLERLPTDDAVAFVLAHEAAHHDCGHLSTFAGWTDWLPRARATFYLAAIIRLVEHHAYSPDREAEADLRAMALCVEAGYDGNLALQAFAIMENDALDRGDYDGVFGPEHLLDPTDPNAGSTRSQVEKWVWGRIRGYLPIRERRERARAWLSQRERKAAS